MVDDTGRRTTVRRPVCDSGESSHMTRYVLRRLALSIVTLFLIILIVFLINNVFPSDVGRRLAGPFAPQEQVDIRSTRSWAPTIR